MQSSTPRRRGARLLVAAVGSALLLSGCGFGAQTLQPYTPAEGVNAQVGTVKVRNLVVVSDEQGKGYLSASLVSSANDTLVKVSGHPILLDGNAGSSLVVTGTPVALSANSLAVLTEPAATLQVSSSDLQPGLLAAITLEFASGAHETIQTPVLSPEDPVYATVSPAPAATATPPAATVSPAPGATPTPTPTRTP
ncbi:hypothetical protein G7070_04765 [Propioniciclava coleopterorum]|uniref:Copper(I)-binding protein n=1 Tax=Propioniciclava coleopterorum TaxID=2714937 RepID=A0A6G7Y507_9ACTN|nr:hypothetical protein [Propioniciclava coleopterorum]QIK71711.1 hypothetical protein G7070_04765 [Propioniciclava coleopterorum]